MKAPNGRPTNLTEEQWTRARTPAFKRRFGDWEAAALIDMAQKTWSGSMTPRRFNFLPSQRLVDVLKKTQGKHVEQVFITDSDLRHIKDLHGKNEGQRGQADITPEDISLIPFVMNEFDNFDEGRPDNRGNRRVEFRKQINGTAYVVGLEHGASKEQVITFWRQKGRMPHADADTNALGGTSETTPTGETVQRAGELRKAKEHLAIPTDENGEPVMGGGNGAGGAGGATPPNQPPGTLGAPLGINRTNSGSPLF
jgi:hypothetical protein